MMGLSCLFGHKYVGCKCERCGKTRDEGHDWDGNRCRICGKTRIGATTEYYESDNVGTRQETVSQANTYWYVERMKMAQKPPFTLFLMPSAAAAEEALLEMPFMHRAKDSGKIICDRIMTYGVYQTEENDAVSQGKYEALITGFDFSLDEYQKAEQAFTSRGGKCLQHEAPDASVRVDNTVGDPAKVQYKETTTTQNGRNTYQVYIALNKADAIAFLKTKPVNQNFHYIIVEIPGGQVGRDINGFFEDRDTDGDDGFNVQVNFINFT